VQPRRPPGAAKHDNYGQEPVDLMLKPSVLVPLGQDRYGLVVSETNVTGAHMNPGAVAIAYVRRRGGSWTVEKVWPEFIWTGNTGYPADAIRVLSFSIAPMVAFTSEYMGQGQGSTTTWVIRLRAGGPEFLGRIPTGDRLEPDACTGCRQYDYRGSIGPPRKRGDILSVTYAGRVETAHGRWRPLHARTDYRSSGGKLVPTERIALPWLTVAGE
jgi:hypothetical protein